MLIDLEAEPRGVAREAQQARGIVAKAAVMQHAQHAPRDVLLPMRRRAHPGVGQRYGDRVDGEVTSQQIFGDRRGLDQRQRPRLGIALAASPGDVDARVPQRDAGRPEAVVGDRLATERAQQRLDRPLDEHIELARTLGSQQVADRTPHEMDALIGRPEQRLAPGLLGGRGQAVRTAIPLSARYALASAIVCRP